MFVSIYTEISIFVLFFSVILPVRVYQIGDYVKIVRALSSELWLIYILAQILTRAVKVYLHGHQREANK